MTQQSKERHELYLKLNNDNIRLHIAEANAANDYHLKAAALASTKAQNYARMLEISTETLNMVMNAPVTPK